ncbi:MAG: hypothetical protein M0R74_02125 [Dehalococcoidia bacterium]|nr:hypothetical protein [Dehalococcoidia bacterium]
MAAKQGREETRDEGVWPWFWWGVFAGAAYGLWRHPGALSCCLLVLVSFAVVFAVLVAIVVWSHWYFFLILVGAVVLYRRWLLPWLRERQDPG